MATPLLSSRLSEMSGPKTSPTKMRIGSTLGAGGTQASNSRLLLGDDGCSISSRSGTLGGCHDYFSPRGT